MNKVSITTAPVAMNAMMHQQVREDMSEALKAIAQANTKIESALQSN